MTKIGTVSDKLQAMIAINFSVDQHNSKPVLQPSPYKGKGVSRQINGKQTMTQIDLGNRNPVITGRLQGIGMTKGTEIEVAEYNIAVNATSLTIHSNL